MPDRVRPKDASNESIAPSLHERLERARSRRGECLAKREELRELLAKAERRRATEPGQREKWEQVISGLESSYAELRLRLEQSEMAIRQCEREMEGMAAEPPEAPGAKPEPAPPSAVADPPDTLQVDLDTPAGFQQILDMPLEDLCRLNLEQLGRICSELEAHPELQREARRVRARLEFANQLNHGGRRVPLNEGGVDQRRQHVLRGAIEKIQMNRLQDLNRQEVQLLIHCRRQLSRRIAPTDRDTRLLGLLSEAVAALTDAGKLAQ